MHSFAASFERKGIKEILAHKKLQVAERSFMIIIALNLSLSDKRECVCGSSTNNELFAAAAAPALPRYYINRIVCE